MYHSIANNSQKLELKEHPSFEKAKEYMSKSENPHFYSIGVYDIKNDFLYIFKHRKDCISTKLKLTLGFKVYHKFRKIIEM